MSRFGWKIYGGDLHMQRFPILSPAYTKGEGLRNLPKKGGDTFIHSFELERG